MSLSVVLLLSLASLADPGRAIGGPSGERGARAYNGGLGAEPPAGVQGQSPLKLKSFQLLSVSQISKI